jgi:predicted regulator of Ras-like GTPase activity (Roadblock/LC7/MglB family)
MNLILTREDISKLNEILETELLKNGMEHVFIVDLSGNVIAEGGNLSMEFILPLAALSAANFGATERIATLIGQKDFTLLFHKGSKHNVHFSRIDRSFILVILFDANTSVGLVRMGSSRVSEQVLPILNK